RVALARQRRPHRPDQPERSVAGLPETDRFDEAGRDQRADSHAARLSDPEARVVDRLPDDAVRAGARADWRPRLHRQTPGGISEVPAEAAHRGDHRVEEPGPEARVRAGDRPARQEHGPVKQTGFGIRDSGFEHSGAETQIPNPQSQIPSATEW